MRPFRLQYLQWWAGAAIAVCSLLLGGMSIFASADAFRRADDASRAFERFRTVMEALSAISAERGPGNVLMSAERDDPAATASLEAARGETDRLLGRVDAALAADTVDSDLLPLAKAVASRLRLGRSLVDDVTAKDRAERSVESLEAAIEGMFAVIDTAEPVRDRIGHEVVRILPEVANEVLFSIAASDLRDYSGRLGSYVVMRLKAGRGDDPEAQRGIAMTLGRLASVRASLANLSGAMEPDTRRSTALEAVERRFFERAMPNAVATAAGAGGPEPMSIAEFTRIFVRDLAPSKELRIVTADLSIARLEQMRVWALRKVAVSGALTLVVCVVLVLLGLVFRHRLFRPLKQARGQMLAIARGDLSEPEAADGAAPEVGDVLAGLHAIRDEQRWRRELEVRQAEMARQLRRLAETDPLTGILNRRAIQDLALRRFGEADWVGESVGLVLFDVDRFKRINDTFGHDAGDEVLRAIVRAVSAALRPQDSFARFGGEEFLVLMPGVGRDEPGLLARRLCALLPRTVAVQKQPITASFGVAVRAPGSGMRWEDLVCDADRRLYAAKRAGRARVVDTDVVAEEAAA